jgi:hypothetical protein
MLLYPRKRNEFIGCRFKVHHRTENDHLNFYEIGYRLREEFWEKDMVMKQQKLGSITVLLNENPNYLCFGKY